MDAQIDIRNLGAEVSNLIEILKEQMCWQGVVLKIICVLDFSAL